MNIVQSGLHFFLILLILKEIKHIEDSKNPVGPRHYAYRIPLPLWLLY